MSRRAKLRKKVSAAFIRSALDDNNCENLRRDQAWDAAIDIVLEEAAKVAEGLYQEGQIGGDIAAAIRELKGQR